MPIRGCQDRGHEGVQRPWNYLGEVPIHGCEQVSSSGPSKGWLGQRQGEGSGRAPPPVFQMPGGGARSVELSPTRWTGMAGVIGAEWRGTEPASAVRHVPRCPICGDLGFPANHRAGSKACAPARRRRRGEVAAPVPAPPEKTVASTAEKRTANIGPSREEEDPETALVESPKPQRVKKRRTEPSSNTQGTSNEKMELEGSAECTH